MGKGGLTGMNKVRKGFYKSAEFRQVVRIGAAAYSAGTEGGFERIITGRQGEWAELHPAYQEQKRRDGKDPRKWIRTGRTLKALSQGKLPSKEGTSKGLRYKITPGRLLAVMRPTVFKGARRGRKPAANVQKKIWKNLNYGIDGDGGARSGGRLIKDKRGRVLNGRPGRYLGGWVVPLKRDIEASIERETAEILREAGFLVR